MAEQRGAGSGTGDRAVEDALEIANQASARAGGVGVAAEPDVDAAADLDTGADVRADVGVDTEEADSLLDDAEERPDDVASAPRHRPAQRLDVDAETLRSRKAFARRQWRRRWLAWRYVVVLLLVIVLLGAGIWAVYFSSWLQVKGPDVHGELKMTSARQVERYAAVPVGQPLATADLKAVRIRVLNGLAQVRSVDVSREWPDKVRIDVTERTPVAVVAVGGSLRALDENGAVFWHYAKPPAGLPMVTTVTGTHTDALREAARVVSALPGDLPMQVDHVEVRTVDSITLALHGGKQVVWGSSASSATKGKVLVALMKAKPDVRHYDVSVPGQPVTR